MLKKLILATLAVGFLVTGITVASAESYVLERIKERGVVNMGHREASVPFAYIDDIRLY